MTKAVGAGRRVSTALRRIGAAALLTAAAGFLGAQERVSLPLLSKRVDPKEFGIQDETITVISGTAFKGNRTGYGVLLGLALFAPLNFDSHFYAALNLPAGAVIDFIGFNNTSDTDSILGVALWQRDRYANLTLLMGFSAPAHGWDTDFAGPLNITVPDHVDKALILEIENAPSPTYEYFGYVEVHWHRTVSPPPATPSFADVPPSDPAYAFIEAIHAAGITAGCGGGNFCPDQAITRKQEATFLAKALGLHWPN